MAPTPWRATPAEVFATELARHRVERPRPIPLSYRPMATAIVGDRPVHVATGTASRRALARVGKRAATTVDTIHLATPRPGAEVIAHELTHVAHPSPVPRFFDDDVRGPEERQAEQVAAVMRRSPILPRTSAAAGDGAHRPPVAPAVGGTIRRTLATGAPTPPGTISAAALAASISGRGDLVQRVDIASHRRGRAATVPTTPPTAIANPPSGPAAIPNTTTEPAATVDLAGQFDRLLELLEDRIVAELERRGGRFRGGF